MCGRRDPNLDQCIKNNVDNLKTKFCDGIPELAIPPANLNIDELLVVDAPKIKVYAKDSKITGLCDFTINSLRTDLDRLHFNFEVIFKGIQINTTYDLNLHILMPIAYKGPMYITIDNTDAKVDMDMKLATKDGYRYVYISEFKINLNVQGYSYDFEMNETESKDLHDILIDFAEKNKKELLKIFKPVLEKEISKRVILISNDIVKLFTYEELFPDRI